MAARTVPTMPDWLAGQKITATGLNQITTYARFWANRPMFKMSQAVAQTLATGAFVTITMDTPEDDTDAGRALGTPWGYTIPAGMGGKWRFTARINFAFNATGGRLVQVYKNGVALGQSTDIVSAATTSSAMAFVSIRAVVAAGDVMTAVGWQSSGGNLLTDVTWPSWFEGQFESLASP